MRQKVRPVSRVPQTGAGPREQCDRGDRRAAVREALSRHATVDAKASVREQIGAQIGLLGMILAIILVGALPVAEAVRVPFLTVAFVAAFYVGLVAKRFLDDRCDR